MNWTSLKTNLRKRGLKDVLNPFKWKVMLWELISDGKVVIEKEEIQSYCEQWVYRSIKCRPCLKAGECTHCGCLMPDAMDNKHNACSDGNWPSMMDPETWGQYKQLMNLTFELKSDVD